MNGGINISLGDLDEIYELLEFHLHEEIGGKISSGEFIATFKVSNLDTEFYELSIELFDDSGMKQKFDAYAYNVSYIDSNIKVKFICSKPEFIKDNIVKSYPTVLSAINGNWSGEFNYSGSDIECDIHQRSESGYQLVSKLLRCIRYKSVYGFRCDSIFVRDLDNNYDFDLDDSGISINITPININKSKVKDLEVLVEDIGVCNSISYSKIFTQVFEEYKDLMTNYLVNESLMRVKGSSSIVVNYSKFEPKLQVGNVIKYTLKDFNYDTFMVYSKDINWDQTKGLNTQIKLSGYDWNSN
jgi:hypothetical protein